MAINPRDALRHIEKGLLFPYFQALVCLKTGKISGFEVLARWKHEELGFIEPSEFISAAQKDGWISDLTLTILRQAFIAANSIPSSFRLSINVSPVQLCDFSLPGQIHRVAKETRFDLRRLNVEFTETALTDDLECAARVARELRALGCRISLDDFGTGYSSLSHLLALPLDELKIDRSFVASMMERNENRKIIAAVVGLGQSLGLNTVAEGIETEDQAEMLRCLGCELGQGWLYGRPFAAKDLATVATLPSFAVKTIVSTGREVLEGSPIQKLAQLRAVFDGSPVGLAFLDQDLRFVNLNQKLADMNGRSVKDHLGNTVAEMIPSTFEYFEPYLLRALEGEAIRDVEVSIPGAKRRKAQRRILSYEPAFDEDGIVIGISIASLQMPARSLGLVDALTSWWRESRFSPSRRPPSVPSVIGG